MTAWKSESLSQNYISSKPLQGWPVSPLSLASRPPTTLPVSQDVGESPTPGSRGSRAPTMQVNRPTIAPFLTNSPTPIEPSMSPREIPTHENTRPVDALHIDSHNDPHFRPQNHSIGPGSKGKLPASYSLPSQQDDPFVDETSTSPIRAYRTSLPIRTRSNWTNAAAQDPGTQPPYMLSPVSTSHSRPATNVRSPMSPRRLSNGESSSHVTQQPNALQHAQASLTKHGMTVGPRSRERSQRKTGSEPPITIDQIWQTCFEPGGRSAHHFSRKLLRFNSEAEDPLKAFPALQKTLKRLKGNNGRNQVTHSPQLSLFRLELT